jgi:hypothetical protein
MKGTPTSAEHALQSVWLQVKSQQQQKSQAECCRIEDICRELSKNKEVCAGLHWQGCHRDSMFRATLMQVQHPLALDDGFSNKALEMCFAH